jgi:hypothetical protein
LIFRIFRKYWFSISGPATKQKCKPFYEQI